MRFSTADKALIQFTTHMYRFVATSVTLTLLLLASPWAVRPARADDVSEARENQFKAAYVFNFIKFVEWPDTIAADQLTVCFLGNSGVYDALAAGIENKYVGTRRLQLRKLKPQAAEVTCDALYVDATAAVNHRILPGQPVLTISDAHDFILQGGIIELFTENHRLRFNINVDSAQKAGLRISSDLLKLAAGVRKQETE